MKTAENLFQADKSNTGEPKQNAKASKGLKYLLFLFMLSSISFLPSCAVAVRSTEPGIAIESHHHGFWHRGNHHHNEYHEQDVYYYK